MPTVGVFAAIFDDEQRILCVKLNYAHRGWATPGGRVEPGESVTAALVREVKEETGFDVEIENLVGVYSAPFKDDLVLMFRARIVSGEWRTTDEIADRGFFAREELPQPMSLRVLRRIRNAFDGIQGIVHVFASETAV